MKKRYAILVRDYKGKSVHTSEPVEQIDRVHRVITAQQIGNFNPLFCRYKGQQFLVHSDAGDASDPFRRTEAYARTFFIDISRPCKK
jgi:hypothetical protein